jgi:hypothetical protein
MNPNGIFWPCCAAVTTPATSGEDSLVPPMLSWKNEGFPLAPAAAQLG